MASINELSNEELVTQFANKAIETIVLGRQGFFSIGVDANGHTTYSEGTYSDPKTTRDELQTELLRRLSRWDVFEDIRQWNPEYDQEKICTCGHPYYRHFDTYEAMRAVGCKYCDCYIFEPQEDEPMSRSYDNHADPPESNLNPNEGPDPDIESFRRESFETDDVPDDTQNWAERLTPYDNSTKQPTIPESLSLRAAVNRVLDEKLYDPNEPLGVSKEDIQKIHAEMTPFDPSFTEDPKSSPVPYGAMSATEDGTDTGRFSATEPMLANAPQSEKDDESDWEETTFSFRFKWCTSFTNEHSIRQGIVESIHYLEERNAMRDFTWVDGYSDD